MLGLSDLWNDFIAWMLGVIQAVAEWFLSIIQSFTHWVWENILGAVAYLLELIPVPGFFTTATQSMGSLPGGVLYLLDPFQIPTGLALIMSAYVLRFMVRRLPFVG